MNKRTYQNTQINTASTTPKRFKRIEKHGSDSDEEESEEGSRPLDNRTSSSNSSSSSNINTTPSAFHPDIRSGTKNLTPSHSPLNRPLTLPSRGVGAGADGGSSSSSNNSRGGTRRHSSLTSSDQESGNDTESDHSEDDEETKESAREDHGEQTESEEESDEDTDPKEPTPPLDERTQPSDESSPKKASRLHDENLLSSTDQVTQQELQQIESVATIAEFVHRVGTDSVGTLSENSINTSDKGGDDEGSPAVIVTVARVNDEEEEVTTEQVTTEEEVRTLEEITTESIETAFEHVSDSTTTEGQRAESVIDEEEVIATTAVVTTRLVIDEEGSADLMVDEEKITGGMTTVEKSNTQLDEKQNTEREPHEITTVNIGEKKIHSQESFSFLDESNDQEMTDIPSNQINDRVQKDRLISLASSTLTSELDENTTVQTPHSPHQGKDEKNESSSQYSPVQDESNRGTPEEVINTSRYGAISSSPPRNQVEHTNDKTLAQGARVETSPPSRNEYLTIEEEDCNNEQSETEIQDEGILCSESERCLEWDSEQRTSPEDLYAVEKISDKQQGTRKVSSLSEFSELIEILADQLRSNPGTISFNGMGVERRQLETLIRFEEFDEVRSLDVFGCDISLDILKRWKYLERLYASHLLISHEMMTPDIPLRTLTVLHLTKTHLTYPSLNALFQTCENLFDMKLVSCGINQLPASVSRMDRLTSVDLSENPINTESVERLLSVCTQLEELSISYTGIESHIRMKSQSVRVLRMSGNELGNDGFMSIIFSMVRGDLSLTLLDISYNDIKSVDGLSRLKSSQLNHLDLSGNSIGEKSLEKIMKNPSLSTLEELRVDNCSIGSGLIIDRQVKTCNIRLLSISNNPIGNEGFRKLMQCRFSITDLDASNCLLDSQCLSGVANLGDLERLDMSCNRLGPTICAVIAEKFPSLSVINLCESDIDFESLGSILSMRHVTGIKASDNPNIRSEESAHKIVRSLFDAASHGTNLKRVDLRGCSISDGGATYRYRGLYVCL